MHGLIRTPIAALLFLLLGCAAGGGPKPEWATAPDADIAGLAQFGWGDAAGSRPLTVFETQVRNAVRAALLEKGYVESADAPDFLIGYEAVEYESTTRSPPVSIGIGVGSWGGNVGGSVGTSVGLGGKTTEHLQQRLTLRAVDAARTAELWIGTTGVLTEQPDAAAIERAVAAVMRGFPARRR